MATKQFMLIANVSTESPAKIKPVLIELLKDGSIKRTNDGFMVKGKTTGESARQLNRKLLSALRRVERKTRLRAEWTLGQTTERFFDYVPKGIREL
jgi:hypothetical protein